MQMGWVDEIFIAISIVCCIAIFISIRFHTWSISINSSGYLLIFALISYLTIGTIVSLARDSEFDIYIIAQQAYHTTITIAAILAGRYILERVGTVSFLKRLLPIQIIISTAILADPFLREVDIVPDHRLSTRLSGTLSDPNDAGIVACVTVIIAGLLIFHGHKLIQGYIGIVVGAAATIVTLSTTSMVVLGIVAIFAIITTIKRARQPYTGHRILLSSLCIVIACIYGAWSFSILFDITVAEEPHESMVSMTSEPPLHQVPSIHIDAHQVMVDSSTGHRLTLSNAYSYTFAGLSPGERYSYQFRPLRQGWKGDAIQIFATPDQNGQLTAVWSDPNDYTIRFPGEDTWKDFSDLTIDSNGGISGFTPDTSYRVQMLPKFSPFETEPTDLQPVALLSGSDSQGVIHTLWPTWEFRDRTLTSPNWRKWRPIRIGQNNRSDGDITVIRQNEPEIQLPELFAPNDQTYGTNLPELTAGYRYDVQLRPIRRDWKGEIIQLSSIADRNGQLSLAWQDHNQYLVQLNSSDTWNDLSDITTSGSHGISVFGPRNENVIELLPKVAPYRSNIAKIVSGANSDGVIHVYWPFWEFRERSPNGIDWRPWRDIDLLDQNVSLFTRPRKVISLAGLREESTGDALLARMDLWEIGFDRIKESPIWGHGLRTFDSLDDAPIGNDGRRLGIHNLYLMLIGESGLVPLILYMLFILNILWHSRTASQGSVERDLASSLVIVIIIYGMTYYHLIFMGYFSILLGLACAVIAHLAYQTYPSQSIPVSSMNKLSESGRL